MDTGTGDSRKGKAYTIKVKLTAIVHTVHKKFITLVWQVDNVLIEAGSPIKAGSLKQAVAEVICSNTRWPKKLAQFLYALTLPNINRFSKFFHCQNQAKICNNTITKDPTTSQQCRYTTLCPIKAA